MRHPSRWLAPRPGPPCRPPPGCQEAAPGDQRAPPTPSSLPLRPMSGRRQTEETPAPHPPRRGRYTRGAGAPRPRQAPARPARCRPTADRRHPGRRKRSRAAPPPPPPHWPVGGRPDRARRPRPPGNPHGTSMSRGGTSETMDDRPTPDGAGGRGGGPPAPPPQLGSHRSGPPPPRSRAPPPPPQKGPRREGGDAAGPSHRAPQRPQPPAPAGVAAVGRAHTSVPEQRAQQAWGRRTAAHQKCMEAAPYMTLP